MTLPRVFSFPLLAGFCLALLIAGARMDWAWGLPMGRFLWAEDGPVFLQMARDNGLASLWASYAGYLHLYPRLVALLAADLPLLMAPWIFFCAWLAAWLLMVGVVVRAAQALGLGTIAQCLTVLLIGCQPSSGEVFFNLTNAQWSLGIATFVLIAVPEAQPGWPPVVRGLLLLLLGLTGPFSALALPVLAFQAWRRWPARPSCSWLLVVACGFVQVLALLTGPPGSEPPLSASIGDIARAIRRTAMFGGSGALLNVASLAFWIGLAAGLWHTRAHSAHGSQVRVDVRRRVSLLLVLGMTVVLTTALMRLSGLTAGTRYTWIPYGLAFMAAIVATRSLPWARAAVVVGAGLICLVSWRAFIPTDFQFDAYARWARTSEVVIPIHPAWPQYPGWAFRWGPRDDTSLASSGSQFIAICDSQRPCPVPATLPARAEKLPVQGQASCVANEFAAVRVDLERPAPGWVRMAWEDAAGATRQSVPLERWYPAGRVEAQFAFRKRGAIRNIGIQVENAESTGTPAMLQVSVACLD